MSDFTYQFPDPQSFLLSLRDYLASQDQKALAELLMHASCEFRSDGHFSHERWHSLDATIQLSVPVSEIPKFDEKKKKQLLLAADLIFPQEAGYELTYIEISPALISHPKDDAPSGNAASPGSVGKIEHDGLHFRSQSRIRIYEELKRKQILFFANATAVFGRKPEKSKPDFLICQNGKWGILEITDELDHPGGATARQDHDRAQLFKEYGQSYIAFFDAEQCDNDPAGVVSEFLKGLEKQKTSTV